MERLARARLLRVSRFVLLGVALVLLVSAFRQFEGGSPPASGPSGFEEARHEAIVHARVSVLLGLAAAFALLGFFAFGEWAKALMRNP